MPSYGVSLLSGGLDSTTVTALAKSKTDHLTALTFHYGQSHSKEVDCAAEVARYLGVTQELLDISFLGKVAWYSALTNPEQFPMPEDREASRMATVFQSLTFPYVIRSSCLWPPPVWRARSSTQLRLNMSFRRTFKHVSTWPPTWSTTVAIPIAGPSFSKRWVSR